MTRPIQDEFSERTDVSKQRRYQLRKARDGRCIKCGAPAVTAHLCEPCRRKANVQIRERLHRTKKARRRRLGAESYLFEGPPKS